MAPLRLRIEGTTFRDEKNRQVTLRGINCAADAKNPAIPDLPSHVSTDFFDGDDVSFVGRPFAADDAHLHFARLRSFGYNTIRYIFTWEAIEHAGPGKYDEEWIQHTIAVLRSAKAYGFHIFMDPHQDVWSRFTGGSGAPLWTIYAVGLDPRNFLATEAALVQNTWPDPASFPKMIWATSYWRLACATIFTLFFAGRQFAPKAIIDGKNIQDYLQERFVGACRHLAQRIHDAGDLERTVVIGWESINEPNRGMIGHQDLQVVPSEQKLRKGTSPTAWQAMLLGSGRACEVEEFEIGGLGPYKTGSRLVDPKGTSAWISTDAYDVKYGWKRDPGWKLGECIWAQHGVWDPATDELLQSDYFACDPQTDLKIDAEHFTNTFFMTYFRRYRDAIRSVDKDCIMLLQPPVLEIPPSIKGKEDDDPNMCYTPHYYDGLTLMTKKWNRFWNVDVFGIMRGRYSSPAFAIKIGETAIRNCLRDQLRAIRQEGLDHMGEHPCLLSEIGIPYDMDEKYAYRTGDYTSQLHALDANSFAIEGSGMAGFTWWNYCATNTHEWGDQWNGEDLSIWSTDDKSIPTHTVTHPSDNSTLGNSTTELSGKGSTDTHEPLSPNTSASAANAVDSSNLRTALSRPSMSSSSSLAAGSPSDSTTLGLRAAEAYVRPSPICTAGRVVSYGFELRAAVFNLEIDGWEVASNAANDNDRPPTEIFLPDFHFPRDKLQVEVSSGRWAVISDDDSEEAEAQSDAAGGKTPGQSSAPSRHPDRHATADSPSGQSAAVESRTAGDLSSSLAQPQRLQWWHNAGPQKLTVTGVRRKLGVARGQRDGLLDEDEEEEGYLDQCSRAARCGVM